MLNFDLAHLDQYLSVGMIWAMSWVGLLWIFLVIWTYRDSRLRHQHFVVHLFFALLVLIFFIPGLALYLLLRRHNTIEETYQQTLEEEALLQSIEENPVCPGCSRKVQLDWLVCPSCNTILKKKCSFCGKLLELPWNICPYCATLTPDALQAKEAAADKTLPVTQSLDDSWSNFDIISLDNESNIDEQSRQPNEGNPLS